LPFFPGDITDWVLPPDPDAPEVGAAPEAEVALEAGGALAAEVALEAGGALAAGGVPEAAAEPLPPLEGFTVK